MTSFVILLGTLIELLITFLKLPRSDWDALSHSLLDFNDNVRKAIAKGKVSGDYSDLEDVFNSRGHGPKL